MSKDNTSAQGIVIAKRSVSLSITYPVIGVFLAFVGLLLASVSGLISQNTPATSAKLTPNIALLSVPLQALAAVIFATPVLLLFVYDKNNGVLEYFLSLGMDQRDVYGQYLKAALILSSTLVVFVVIIDAIAGLVEGTALTMLEVSGLVVVLAISAVALASVTMMSFSSLQKQRVGSNQPLGMAIAVFIIMPAYLASLVAPSFAFQIDLGLSGAVALLSILTYSLSGRMISRDKLLP